MRRSKRSPPTLCLSRRQLLKSQDFEIVPVRATLRSGPLEGLSRWDRRGFFTSVALGAGRFILLPGLNFVAFKVLLFFFFLMLTLAHTFPSNWYHH